MAIGRFHNWKDKQIVVGPCPDFGNINLLPSIAESNGKTIIIYGEYDAAKTISVKMASLDEKGKVNVFWERAELNAPAEQA